jgi:hypothetical protein
MEPPIASPTDNPKVEAKWHFPSIRFIQSSLFWLIFGFLVFPVIAIVFLVLELITISGLGLVPNGDLPEFGYGGGLGLFLGVPLGIVSSLSAWAWRHQQFGISPFLAFLGGSSIGGLWLALSLPVSPLRWIGEFGFVVLPLV